MILERYAMDFYLIGILHGSKSRNCSLPNTGKSPSLFANLEEPGNLEFVTKWKNLGHFFLADNLEKLDKQTSVSINYMDPHLMKQSLWRNYTKNQDVFDVIYFKICQDSNTPNDNHGIDCSLYDQKKREICANGKSSDENFEIYGVNCGSKQVGIPTRAQVGSILTDAVGSFFEGFFSSRPNLIG